MIYCIKNLKDEKQIQKQNKNSVHEIHNTEQLVLMATGREGAGVVVKTAPFERPPPSLSQGPFATRSPHSPALSRAPCCRIETPCSATTWQDCTNTKQNITNTCLQ